MGLFLYIRCTIITVLKKCNLFLIEKYRVFQKKVVPLHAFLKLLMKKIYVLVLLWGLVPSLFAEKLVGVITDAFTREPLIGVTVLNTDDGSGTVTDFDGSY